MYQQEKTEATKWMDLEKLKTNIEILINKAKIAELSQENEESTLLTSFDRLLKSDIQVAEAIATIRKYITQQQEHHTAG